MPKSKSRGKAQQQRARQTQLEQHKAEVRKVTPQQYALRRASGWTLVGVAIVVGVSHLLQHIGVFHLLSPGWADLTIGYPTAALVGIGAAIVLSK